MGIARQELENLVVETYSQFAQVLRGLYALIPRGRQNPLNDEQSEIIRLYKTYCEEFGVTSMGGNIQNKIHQQLMPEIRKAHNDVLTDMVIECRILARSYELPVYAKIPSNFPEEVQIDDMLSAGGMLEEADTGNEVDAISGAAPHIMAEQVTVETVRQKIADLARSHIGSSSWDRFGHRTGSGVTALPFAPKCNLFVYEMLRNAGLYPGRPHTGGRIHRRFNDNVPKTAADWASRSFYIPGWRILESVETPMPGDIAATVTHVGIVTGNRLTTSVHISGPVVENEWGFRDGQAGQVIFRRLERIE